MIWHKNQSSFFQTVVPLIKCALYSAGQTNGVKGCVSRGFNHATFDHVFLDSIKKQFTWIEALRPEVPRGPLSVVHAADEPARLAVRVVFEDLVGGARVHDDRVHGHGAGDALK